MKDNIMILGMEMYHPDNVVENEFYLKKFKKSGKDVSKLLVNIFGRINRFEINNTGKLLEECENSLTMEIIAAKKVLEHCNMKGSDIDGIIAAGQILEYMVPCNAAFVYEAIEGREDCFFYDLNANCAGMVMAYQQAVHYMACNSRLNNLLVVSGDYMTFGIDPEDEKLYGVFGDSACAMILTRTKTDSGLIDTDYFIHNMVSRFSKVPACGFSNVFEAATEDLLVTQKESISWDIDKVIAKMESLLKKHNLTVNDIAAFCFSQYVKSKLDEICSWLEIPEEKCPYVGDEYGYTGTNSPFLALLSKINNEEIHRGDYLFFWTIGAGMQHIFLLMKF